MKKLQSMLAMACFVFLAILIVFAGNAVAKEKTGKQTLKIKIASNGFLMGSFAKDGRIIYFEVVRGEENPKGDPDAPKFAVDVRIMDANRLVFIGQIGGHGLFDSGWKEEYQALSSFPINTNERMLDFKLLPDMVRALKEYSKSHKNNQLEIKTLINMATIKDSELVDHEFNAEEEWKQLSSLAVTSGRIYKHRIAICKKKVWDGYSYEHSAVKLEISEYSSGKVLLRFYTTNHGTSSKDMSEKCSSSLLRYDTKVYIWDNACDCLGFPYNPRVHVCNNDTKQEFQSQYNGSTRHWGYCVPWLLYAPNCN